MAAAPDRGGAGIRQLDVSVVAVSWNSREILPAALDCVSAACGPMSWETIVVDNGSADGSVETLAARVDADLVALDDNTGFTHAANVGAARAVGRHLLFLNPDVLAPPGSIAALVQLLDDRPEAWGATPWFRNRDGTPQWFWRRLPTARHVAFCLTRPGRRVDRVLGGPALRNRRYGELPDPPGIVPIDGVGAACLLVRRAEFERAGGFDERYFNFFQDAELQRRMLRAGRALLGVGTVSVIHEGGATLRGIPPWALDAEFLHAARQYLAGEPWWRRSLGEAAIRVDLALPGPERHQRRSRALRPLVRKAGHSALSAE